MSDSSRYRVIPFLDLSPANCRVVAERGKTAIARLGPDQLGQMLRNRWTVALQRLNEIADRGTYSQAPAELQIDIQAITLATDFFQIADILPPEIPEHIGRELAKALDGNLEPNQKSRVADAFLSQFWFGVVLARGGIAPRVPKPAHGRTPDYVVSVDTLDVAVEVKRPESVHSAPDAMDEAASQLREYGKPGFIALDLTDALFPLEMAVVHMDHPGLLVDVVTPQFITMTNELEGRAENYTRSDKYAKVLGLAFFARLHHWEKPDLSPKGKHLLSLKAFPRAYNGIVADHSRKLKRIVGDGAADVAGGAARRL